MDSLAPEVVEPLLRGRFGRPYRYVERCESTQRLLTEGDPEGAVAATEEQTAGRGRLGRTWEAPPQTSVLVSVLLRPPVGAERWPTLSPVAGAAVAEAVTATTGAEASLKLPNDVLVHGRKVAGVLAEASDGRIILGIGVNANQTREQLPSGAHATSLRLETGRAVARAELLAAILDRLEDAYDRWVSESGAAG